MSYRNDAANASSSTTYVNGVIIVCRSGVAALAQALDTSRSERYLSVEKQFLGRAKCWFGSVERHIAFANATKHNHSKSSEVAEAGASCRARVAFRKKRYMQRAFSMHGP